MFDFALKKQGFIEDKPANQLNLCVHIPKCAGGTISHHFKAKYRLYELEGVFDPWFLRRSIVAATSNSFDDPDMQPMTRPWFARRSWIVDYLKKFPSERVQAVEYVFGHLTYRGIHELFGKPGNYYTMMREPFERMISYYNYMATVRVNPDRLKVAGIVDDAGQTRTIDRWFEEANLAYASITGYLSQMYDGDRMFYYITELTEEDLTRAQAMLDMMTFVGLTDQPDDLLFIYNRFGICHKTPDAHVLSTKSTYARPQNMEYARRVFKERYPQEYVLYEQALKLNHEFKRQCPSFGKAVRYTRLTRFFSGLKPAFLRKPKTV